MIILIRGGGDLASGVALRLHRAGLRVAITELPEPLAIRRTVSFAQAIYAGEITIEGITGRRVKDPEDSLKVLQIFGKKQVPVLVDVEARSVQALHPAVVVDARMLKTAPEPLRHPATLYIGLGPGFIAGQNCHAVIETRRGHFLGRVIWQGAADEDTGEPEHVAGYGVERVLRAPAAGLFEPKVEICDIVEENQVLAEVGGHLLPAPFRGVVRGLLHTGLEVQAGSKVGDLDPRADSVYCSTVSDKALAVGGGVLEAILSRPELRPQLWK